MIFSEETLMSKFNIKTVLEKFLVCTIEDSWLNCPEEIPEQLLQERNITNEVVIAIHRWKAGFEKKSRLLNRLLKTEGTHFNAKKLCKDLDNLYKREGAKGLNLSDEFVIPSKPALASPSTQLTPQLKKLRMVHKSPQTPTRPRQINSSRLPGTRTVTRTVVRIIKVQKNEENRKICRLKRKIKSLKVDIRSSKQIAEQKLAEERVCLLVHW
jgi:hypothetical protein